MQIRHFSREVVFNTSESTAGRGGLVVGRPTAVRDDPGSNLTACLSRQSLRYTGWLKKSKQLYSVNSLLFLSHPVQPWARVVHPYCSA